MLQYFYQYKIGFIISLSVFFVDPWTLTLSLSAVYQHSGAPGLGGYDVTQPAIQEIPAAIPRAHQRLHMVNTHSFVSYTKKYLNPFLLMYWWQLWLLLMFRQWMIIVSCCMPPSIRLLDTFFQSIELQWWTQTRPIVTVTLLVFSSRWQYVIMGIMEVDVKPRLHMWSWQRIHRHRQTVKCYRALYKSKITNKKPTEKLLREVEVCGDQGHVH